MRTDQQPYPYPTSSPLLISQRQHHPRHRPALILQRRPVQHELLEAHVRPCAKLELQTDRTTHFQRAADCRLEVVAYAPRTVIGQELEDVHTECLIVVRVLRLDREQQVRDSGGEEGDEEGGVVY